MISIFCTKHFLSALINNSGICILLKVTFGNVFIPLSKIYYQARSQAEAMKPELQHKFGNLTLFFVYLKLVQMTSNGPGHSISNKTTFPLSTDSDQPAQMSRMIRVIALR